MCGKAFHRGLFPVQRLVQTIRTEEPLDLIHSDVTPSLDIPERKFHLAVGIVEFFCPHSSRPPRFEARQNTSDLVAVYAVATFVRAASRCKLDLTARDGLGHDCR